ncbi:endonuclease 8-like 1 isoform X1 [Lepus europaeus]|uniref:endonuclease 8-like 1 isoform X1 n=1 Tax=Lepus europaeus TaxID=9983 RepID=UPI002B464022|nr:endonuclease 8-like 1 isoform X1 [Lepus europaeus]
MPEGPELHLASHFVNEACGALVFGGRVEKSAVSRNPEVPFESSAYRISALARGKELRLWLRPLPGAGPCREPLALVFRFGMTGSFQLAPGDALPRHAHLRFYTAGPGPRLALCFVDVRRFGHWELGGEWQPGRGPCVLRQYEQFREHVLRNLADKTFDRPICEALLDQRFFNGIGNYLRAEILFRLRIPPFEKARTVLQALQQRRLSPTLTLSQKIRAKLQNPDLLELCHLVPKEVVQLGGKGYGPERGQEDFAAFRAWLRCYGVPGMSTLQDRLGRTMWFQVGAEPPGGWGVLPQSGPRPDVSLFHSRGTLGPWCPKGPGRARGDPGRHSRVRWTGRRTLPLPLRPRPRPGNQEPKRTLPRLRPSGAPEEAGRRGGRQPQVGALQQPSGEGRRASGAPRGGSEPFLSFLQACRARKLKADSPPLDPEGAPTP